VPKGYFTVIVPHDFLFFCTRDYNAEGIMEQIIGNYALMYALNNNVSEIHRLASGTKPFYAEDQRRMRIYATPASPLFHLRVPSDFLSSIMNSAYQSGIKYEAQQKVKFTYNAVGELIAFGMKPATLNIPNLGNYEKLTPLNIFYTFIFGGKGPSVIRLGKKQVPCRLHFYEIEKMTEIAGEYSPNHPININELEIQSNNIISGELVYVRPTPLLVNARLKGKFLKCTVNNVDFYVMLPNISIYPQVFQ
jgi:CRISPR type I-D-associated protein Csc1